MSKYTPFGVWLRKQPQNSVVLTFAEIEKIISGDLPPTAHKNFTFWANIRGSSLQESWLDAGWKTVMVDLENEKVKFQRI